MQEYRPFLSFQQLDDVGMIEEEQVVNHVSVLQPVVTSPLVMIPGQNPLIATEQLAAISGRSPTKSGALSLTDALKSTMSPNTSGRMVVIPGSKKHKKARQHKAASTLHMSLRLRHGVVVAAIVLVAIITLLSLAPLANGQRGLPILSAIGNWVSAQQLAWQIQSHNTTVSVSQPSLPPMGLPKSQYVAIAQQDAIAAGIPANYFVRQINVESGFNPNAVSPSGAVGIAQFLPSTAAGHGINPWDPIQALRGAAQLMASYTRNYGGDYAKALAAYNAGSANLQYAISNCGASWLNCVPGETRHYIYVIMGI
jgi:Transglycosylase SLT domain